VAINYIDIRLELKGPRVFILLLGIASYVVYFNVDLPSWANWFMWSNVGGLTLLGVLMSFGRTTDQQAFQFSKLWTFTVLCPWLAFLNPLWWIIFWVLYGLIGLILG
tara:strand:- start:445 stop:765 length:321 start_codon:yes stop_codon:yes gene_type:complete